MACSPTLAHSEGESLVYELVAVVRLARLEAGLHGGERLVPPLRESGGGDLEFSAEGVEGLALEESQDDLGLTPRGPSALVEARPARRSGRPTASLRVGPGTAAWCVVHGRHCGRDSQSGVSRNRAPIHPDGVLGASASGQAARRLRLLLMLQAVIVRTKSKALRSRPRYLVRR
jgi:hypothetical protein